MPEAWLHLYYSSSPQPLWLGGLAGAGEENWVTWVVSWHACACAQLNLYNWWAGMHAHMHLAWLVQVELHTHVHVCWLNAYASRAVHTCMPTHHLCTPIANKPQPSSGEPCMKRNRRNYSLEKPWKNKLVKYAQTTNLIKFPRSIRKYYCGKNKTSTLKKKLNSN